LFTSSCYEEYDDEEMGFFAVYRKAFEKLKTEEENARIENGFEEQIESFRKVPGFGNATSSQYEVFSFYEYWQYNFTSCKKFD